MKQTEGEPRMTQKRILTAVDAATAAIINATQGLQREVCRLAMQTLRTTLLEMAIDDDAGLDYCLVCGDVIGTESGLVCCECAEANGKSKK